MLHQVPVPLAFVGRTYGELVSALLLVEGAPAGAKPANGSGNAAGAEAGGEAAGPAEAPADAPLPAPWPHEVPLGLLRRKSENRGWR
jgi:hypothetical protein